MSEPLMELFKRKKKEKMSNWKPSDDDKVIESGNKDKYKTLFSNTVKFVESIVKKVIDQVDLDSDDVTIEETDMGEYVKLYMFKDIVSFPKNYDKLKEKYPKVFKAENYDDVDGGKLHKWMTDNILRKTTSKSFAEYRYTDMIYNYTKEGVSDTFLGIAISDDYTTISVSMTIYYKKSDLKESSLDFESGEPLMELFKKMKKVKKEVHEKNHPLPKKIQAPSKTTYKQDQIVKEIKDILACAKKVLVDPKYKEFINHGVELAPFYLAMDMSASSISNMELYDEYETGQDFIIVEVDVWDYTKCGARTYQDEGYDTHPVNDAVMEICTEIREYVYKKYPQYQVEIEGDWDTYSIMLTLK